MSDFILETVKNIDDLFDIDRNLVDYDYFNIYIKKNYQQNFDIFIKNIDIKKIIESKNLPNVENSEIFKYVPTVIFLKNIMSLFYNKEELINGSLYNLFSFSFISKYLTKFNEFSNSVVGLYKDEEILKKLAESEFYSHINNFLKIYELEKNREDYSFKNMFNYNLNMPIKIFFSNNINCHNKDKKLFIRFMEMNYDEKLFNSDDINDNKINVFYKLLENMNEITDKINSKIKNDFIYNFLINSVYLLMDVYFLLNLLFYKSGILIYKIISSDFNLIGYKGDMNDIFSLLFKDSGKDNIKKDEIITNDTDNKIHLENIDDNDENDFSEEAPVISTIKNLVALAFDRDLKNFIRKQEKNRLLLGNVIAKFNIKRKWFIKKYLSRLKLLYEKYGDQTYLYEIKLRKDPSILAKKDLVEYPANIAKKFGMFQDLVISTMESLKTIKNMEDLVALLNNRISSFKKNISIPKVEIDENPKDMVNKLERSLYGAYMHIIGYNEIPFLSHSKESIYMEKKLPKAKIIIERVVDKFAGDTDARMEKQSISELFPEGYESLILFSDIKGVEQIKLFYEKLEESYGNIIGKTKTNKLLETSESTKEYYKDLKNKEENLKQLEIKPIVLNINKVLLKTIAKFRRNLYLVPEKSVITLLKIYDLTYFSIRALVKESKRIDVDKSLNYKKAPNRKRAVTS